MLLLTYCRKTVVKGGMVSHVGYHDTISVNIHLNYSFPASEYAPPSTGIIAVAV
jgi:hypothetical protein